MVLPPQSTAPANPEDIETLPSPACGVREAKLVMKTLGAWDELSRDGGLVLASARSTLSSLAWLFSPSSFCRGSKFNRALPPPRNCDCHLVSMSHTRHLDTETGAHPPFLPPFLSSSICTSQHSRPPSPVKFTPPPPVVQRWVRGCWVSGFQEIFTMPRLFMVALGLYKGLGLGL